MPEIREELVETEFEAPVGKLESLVADIQAAVLGVDRVSRSDSFYDLGGTSVQAIRICARLERETGHKALPVWLFDSDSLADFAECLAGAEALSQTTAASPQIRHRLSFAQQRLWLVDQLTPGSTDYNAFESYELLGELNAPALRAALEDTIARHDALRTTFYSLDGVPYLRIAESIATPFEFKALTAGPDSDGPDSDVTAAIDREARRPFNLEKGPLLRLTLLRLAQTRHILLAVLHHIIIDERSLEVFWRDFSAYYRARVTGEPITLPPLSIDYAEYAARQRAALQGETFDGLLGYWRGHLDGAPLRLEIPTDFPRSEPRESANALIRFTLPAPTVRAAARLAATTRATTFMVLLAAFSVAIRFAAGQEDLIVGTFAANRSSVDVEDLIGLFVNLLPLRIFLHDDLTFTDLVTQVRSTALDAFRHQELPFDHLVDALRPPRDLTRNPVAQVAFVSFGARSGRLSLPGLTCTLAGEGQGGNALDILAAIEETGDELSGEFHYRADLFAPSTAEDLTRQFTRIVADATSHPNRTLSDLAQERQK